MKLKIPHVIFLLIFFILMSLFIYRADNVQMKWVAILGVAIFTGAKIGQALGSGNEKLFDFFSIFSKSGLLIFAGAIILKATLIIRQKEVCVAGNHVQGTAAIWQGIFLIGVGIFISIYVIKKVN